MAWLGSVPTISWALCRTGLGIKLSLEWCEFGYGTKIPLGKDFCNMKQVKVNLLNPVNYHISHNFTKVYFVWLDICKKAHQWSSWNLNSLLQRQTFLVPQYCLCYIWDSPLPRSAGAKIGALWMMLSPPLGGEFNSDRLAWKEFKPCMCCSKGEQVDTIYQEPGVMVFVHL